MPDEMVDPMQSQISWLGIGRQMHAEGAGETHLFTGKPKVFFLAYCFTCWPDRWAPMPFGGELERDKWATEHLSGPLSRGHDVRLFVEVRT